MNHFIQHYLWPIIAGLAIAALVVVIDPFKWQLIKPTQPVVQQTSISFADAIALAAPAVVNIYALKTVEVRRNNISSEILRFLPRNLRTEKRLQNSLGSGVIVSNDGYVLTAMHVIQGAEQILVLLSDGREVGATIVGNDIESDLALLKIDLDNLPTIQIGDPKKSRIGDVVLAIGNPGGIGQSVSQGIISGLNRSVSRMNTKDQYIQTDANFNFGSSGGALIDDKGNILGINKSAVSSGIGFATPIDVALKIVDSIIENDGWLGFAAGFLPNEEIAKLQADYGAGLLVDGIYPTSPAAQGGLKMGDVVLLMDNKLVESIEQVRLLISEAKPGRKVSLQVYRDEQIIDLELTAIEQPN